MPTTKYSELTEEKQAILGDCFWGPPDEERYYHTEIDEAIEMALDACHPDRPEEITIVAMTPMEVTMLRVGPDQILERTLEDLCEEFGDPDEVDCGCQDPNDKMKAAAVVFASVIAEEYRAWTCEESLRVVVDDVEAWVKEHCPHWLKDGSWAEGQSK